MGRDSTTISRSQGPYKSSADKKEHLRFLSKNVDFSRFRKHTGFDLDYLQISCKSNCKTRKNWREKQRQKKGVYPKNHDHFCEELTHSFTEKERELVEKFDILKNKKSTPLDSFIDLMREFRDYIPGSGQNHQLIRYVGHRFFLKKETATPIDSRSKNYSSFVAKIS